MKTALNPAATVNNNTIQITFNPDNRLLQSASVSPKALAQPSSNCSSKVGLAKKQNTKAMDFKRHRRVHTANRNVTRNRDIAHFPSTGFSQHVSPLQTIELRNPQNFLSPSSAQGSKVQLHPRTPAAVNSRKNDSTYVMAKGPDKRNVDQIDAV